MASTSRRVPFKKARLVSPKHRGLLWEIKVLLLGEPPNKKERHFIYPKPRRFVAQSWEENAREGAPEEVGVQRTRSEMRLNGVWGVYLSPAGDLQRGRNRDRT